LLQQVFWLPDHPSYCAFPPVCFPAVTDLRLAVDVPGYSGGSATDLHRVPILLRQFSKQAAIYQINSQQAMAKMLQIHEKKRRHPCRDGGVSCHN
jgi:hypothetical protein